MKLLLFSLSLSHTHTLTHTLPPHCIHRTHIQIQEIKEAVELPLTHPELYEEIGIRPPKGVVLYGEPGEITTCQFIFLYILDRTPFDTTLN